MTPEKINENFGDCLDRMKNAFSSIPKTKSGLLLEMPVIAEILESQKFPVNELNLGDFSKYYPFHYVSIEWTGYLASLFAFKIIEKIASEDYGFLNDPAFQDFLYFLENPSWPPEEIKKFFPRGGFEAFQEALMCIVEGLPSDVPIDDKFDLARMLTGFERWSNA